METQSITNTKKSFVGESSNGNFQDALNNAIYRAQEQEQGADMIIKWKFEEAYGEDGGFTGNKKVFVKINVE